jgi:hypothetical protein
VSDAAQADDFVQRYTIVLSSTDED